MTARDVREVILTRLPALGSPGERFFPDPDTDREAAWEMIAREYVEALQQFDRPTLERAFARVRDTNTTGFWPSPGRFRQAALSLLGPTPDADTARRTEAERLAEAYVSRYLRTNRLYKEATKDGWSGELLAYVQAAASVQAQVIAGTSGISWDAVLLDPTSDADPRVQIARFVSECREKTPAEIKVQVPKARIEGWRTAAAEGPAPNADTHWQEVVARITAAAKRNVGPGG